MNAQTIVRTPTKLSYDCAMLRLFFGGFAIGLGLSTAQAQCPVPIAARPYVEEVVVKLIFDTTFVTTNVHYRDRGFALSLFGIDNGYLGQLFLAQECTMATAYKPTYDTGSSGNDKWTSRLQVVCETRSVEALKLAVASSPGKPLKNLNAFQLLSYSAIRFPGTVTYEPFPNVSWRTIKLSEGNFVVNANVSHRLIFQPAAGAPVNLTHAATLSGRVANNEPLWAHVQAIFPSLLTSDRPLAVDIAMGKGGSASGMISSDGTTLATVSGTGFQPIITWQGDCTGP